MCSRVLNLETCSSYYSSSINLANSYLSINAKAALKIDLGAPEEIKNWDKRTLSIKGLKIGLSCCLPQGGSLILMCPGMYPEFDI